MSNRLNKYGVEIYEGDIVRSDDTLAGRGAVPYKPTGEIVWGSQLSCKPKLSQRLSKTDSQQGRDQNAKSAPEDVVEKPE